MIKSGSSIGLLDYVGYDKFMSKTANIAILLYPGIETLDLAGPAGVFSEANQQLGSKHYRLDYVCIEPEQRITSSAGLELIGCSPRQLPDSIDMLLVPGADTKPIIKAANNQKLISTIHSISSRANRIASVCSGAFLLGAAGLLDGRRATTHWAGIAALRRLFPETMVEDDGLYTRDKNLWTSAGVLAGVDMALAIVREDLGPDVSLRVARRLVVYLVRHGAQSQFSSPLNLQAAGNHSRLQQLIAWTQAHLSDPIGVTDMADYLAVSERSLHRHCNEVFGKGPGKLLTDLRLDRARELLQKSDSPLKQMARECGFASPAAMSKAFNHKYGVSPAHYRRMFQASPDIP